MSQPENRTPGSPIAPSDFVPLSEAGPAARASWHPLRWLLGGAVAVFALVMLFLFLARSVAVNVEATAPVEIDLGGGLTIALGERYLMLPGTFTLQASAEGYHTLDTEFTVDDAQTQDFQFTLRPLPGVIGINTLPPGATVTIGEEVVGTTPLSELSLEPGEHVITLNAERYLSAEQTLNVEGRAREQRFEFPLEPAWADVTLTSEPAGAAILVDGEQIGETPATVEILQGDRQLLLTKPGFASHQQDLSVSAGETLSLPLVILPPADALLSLSSTPSGANVTVDGEFRGQTPLELNLTPDEPHRVSVFRPGYRRSTKVVELTAAERDELEVALRAELGEVELRILPAGAEVKVNGRVVGSGSRTVSLPAHSHNLEVALAGYAPIRRQFTPRPGVGQVIDIRLVTEQEARRARLQARYNNSVGQTLQLFEPNDTFTMGASRREPGRRANEVLHPVSLNRMFYLGTHEVTNAQFRQFQADHNSGQIQGNSLNREDQPVVEISWQQAAQFCNWLSTKEGLPPFYRQDEGIVVGFNPGATGYRLPTEAEWAWAARQFTDGLKKFPWGDEFPPKKTVENYADTTAAPLTGRHLVGYKDGFVATAPVGSFDANPRGLFDMGGNVAEWVNDVYSIATASDQPEVNPMGAQRGDNYVIRGASWSHSRISELRLSFRDYGQAGRDDVGFRIARFAE